jgi:hypothetical protein
VVLDGAVLGKPKDAADARRMLSALSGRTHTVLTGLTAVRGGEVVSHTERTEVRFRPLTDAEIDAYIATGEPLDKAGAYGAQGLASLFVERLEGDFFNVMGLPLCALWKLLKRLDVSLIEAEALPLKIRRPRRGRRRHPCAHRRCGPSLLHGRAGALKNADGALKAPLEKAATALLDWMEDIYGYIYDYDRISEENNALRAENAEPREAAPTTTR